MGRRKRAVSLAKALSRAHCDRCGRVVWLREVDGRWTWTARANVKPDPAICPASGADHVVVGRPFWVAPT